MSFKSAVKTILTFSVVILITCLVFYVCMFISNQHIVNDVAVCADVNHDIAYKVSIIDLNNNTYFQGVKITDLVNICKKYGVSQIYAPQKMISGNYVNLSNNKSEDCVFILRLRKNYYRLIIGIPQSLSESLIKHVDLKNYTVLYDSES